MSFQELFRWQLIYWCFHLSTHNGVHRNGGFFPEAVVRSTFLSNLCMIKNQFTQDSIIVVSFYD